MFDFSSVWNIAFRTLIIYSAVFIGLRITGKRQLGQMTPFDLVLLLLIANSVQNSMLGTDSSVTGGLVAAGVLVACNLALAFVGKRFGFAQKLLKGSPVVLVNHGEFVQEHLLKDGIGESQVMMAIREHGLSNVEDVELAVLETAGTISVVPLSAKPMRTTRRIKFLGRR
ncbi:MAG: DUF421 domain-containing protein [Dehalococcoidia bacterium]|nr:DUF421 domain-containing protein [Dehalococcoidia bacterium]